jgi:hypothetical protein
VTVNPALEPLAASGVRLQRSRWSFAPNQQAPEQMHLQ